MVSGINSRAEYHVYFWVNRTEYDSNNNSECGRMQHVALKESEVEWSINHQQWKAQNVVPQLGVNVGVCGV